MSKLLRASRLATLIVLIGLFGCGGGIGELIVFVAVVKLVCVAAVCVLTVALVYQHVEAARLENEGRPRLIVDGRDENGRPLQSVVVLTAEQYDKIREKGKAQLTFPDGRKSNEFKVVVK